MREHISVTIVYIQKARYQKHIQKYLGTPGVVYNFTKQNLVNFEDNIGNKGDLPQAYMNFETAVPAENFLTQSKIKCLFHIR